MNKKLLCIWLVSSTLLCGMQQSTQLTPTNGAFTVIKSNAEKKESTRSLVGLVGYGTSAFCFTGAALLTSLNIPEIPEVLCIQGFLAASVTTGLIMPKDYCRKGKKASHKNFNKRK